MTITNPNATGTLYYKLVPDGTAKDEVSYAVYAEPLNISEQSVTIYAYIVDGINSSEYAKSVYTYKAPVIRKVSLEADISRFCRSSHLVYIASFCYNYSAEKWEEIVLTQ